LLQSLDRESSLLKDGLLTRHIVCLVVCKNLEDDEGIKVEAVLYHEKCMAATRIQATIRGMQERQRRKREQESERLFLDVSKALDKVDQVNDEEKKNCDRRLLAAKMGLWQEQANALRKLRVALVKVVKRWTNNSLALAWGRWWGEVWYDKELRRQRSLLERMVLRNAWASWLDTAKELRRQGDLLQKFALRMRNKSMFKAWAYWDMNVKELRRQKSGALRLMTRRFLAVVTLKERLEKVRYATVFGSWQDWTAVERKLRVVGTKVETTVCHRCLHTAWASWQANGKDLRRQRNLLERVTLRMRRVFFHRAWASWRMTVKKLQRRRSLLEKMALRMRNKGVHKAWSSWDITVKLIRAVESEKERSRLQLLAISEFGETEKEELSRAGEREKERRIVQAKRIVRRLLHSQLLYAFDSYAYRVSEVRRQRETVRRVVQRMQQRALARAFDFFIGTAGQLKAKRQIVHKTMGRWRKKAMATAMWAWMEYMEDVAQERKDEALNEVRNQLSGMSETNKTEQEELNRAVQMEKKRRTEQAERIVRRMLHNQLAHVFYSYAYRVSEVSQQRETKRRTILKMNKCALAGAFDMVIGMARQLQARDAFVLKTMQKLARCGCMHHHLASWRDNAQDCRRQSNVVHKVQSLVRCGCMHHHLASWRNNAKERRRGRNLLERFSLRIRHRKLYTAWASLVAHVKDVRRLQEQLKKMVLQRYFQHHLIQYHEIGDDTETSVSMDSDSD
jgi:hypothetical protein